MRTIEIWSPRYKDNTVLIASYKVKKGRNYVEFTKAPHLTGFYWATDKDIKASPVQKNGKIIVYCVPFDKFTHYNPFQAPLQATLI